MDEFKRRLSISNFLDKEKALTTSKKRKWKKHSKGHWYEQCKVPSHNTDKYWILYPTLRPKKAKTEKSNGTDKTTMTKKSNKNSKPTKATQPKAKSLIRKRQ